MVMNNEQEDFYREFNLIKARKNPSTIALRTHQTQAIKNLKQWYEKDYNTHKGGILVLPTGGGKTFTAVRFLCEGPLSDGYKVLWLAHTHHLLEQAFYSFGPRQIDVSRGYEVGYVQEPKNKLNIRVVSGNKNQYNINEIQPTDDVLIATLQTVSRGFKRNQPNLEAFLILPMESYLWSLMKLIILQHLVIESSFNLFGTNTKVWVYWDLLPPLHIQMKKREDG
nr:DEAD/DEAH box helicase family protein [Methanobacterium formicicum]